MFWGLLVIATAIYLKGMTEFTNKIIPKNHGGIGISCTMYMPYQPSQKINDIKNMHVVTQAQTLSKRNISVEMSVLDLFKASVENMHLIPPNPNQK